MTLNDNDYDLQEEYDRLTEEMERYADRLNEAEPGSNAAARAAEQGQRAGRLRSGVSWAMSEFDADSVRLGALTNGERHRVDDVVDDTGWKRSDVYIAAGLVEAPFLRHDPEAITDEEFRETVLEVVDLHPAFCDFLEQRITDLSRMGDEGNSFRELVEAKQTSET